MWKIHLILIQRIFLINSCVSKINKLLSVSGNVNKLRKVFGLLVRWVGGVGGKEGGGRSRKSGLNRFRLKKSSNCFFFRFVFLSLILRENSVSY